MKDFGLLQYFLRWRLLRLLRVSFFFSIVHLQHTWLSCHLWWEDYKYSSSDCEASTLWWRATSISHLLTGILVNWFTYAPLTWILLIPLALWVILLMLPYLITVFLYNGFWYNIGSGIVIWYILFSTTSWLQLRAYSADWEQDPTIKVSTTSYCTPLGSSLVSWKNKKHGPVHFRRFLADFEVHIQSPTPLLITLAPFR